MILPEFIGEDVYPDEPERIIRTVMEYHAHKINCREFYVEFTSKNLYESMICNLNYLCEGLIRSNPDIEIEYLFDLMIYNDSFFDNAVKLLSKGPMQASLEWLTLVCHEIDGALGEPLLSLLGFEKDSKKNTLSQEIVPMGVMYIPEILS